MKKKIRNLIDDSKSILLLTHESPDGDAIGSVLAFYHYLKTIDKDVTMVVFDIPKVFSFLPAINDILNVDDNKEYDLGIVVDCSTIERIGQNEDLFGKCKKTICVDHHASNTKYCDLNYVMKDVSSCCQVIYSLFLDWNVEISLEIGESIMAGVLTDTNGFGNNNVDEDTFKLAYDMKKRGIDIYNEYQLLLNRKTMSQYMLMKIGMERLEFLCDGKIAFTYILEDDFKKVGASLGEHEGIVDIGRNIDGVLVSIFIREDKGWTISLRSTGLIDVGEIAISLGGGGHMMASGGKLIGTFEEVREKVIKAVEKAITEKR